MNARHSDSFRHHNADSQSDRNREGQPFDDTSLRASHIRTTYDYELPDGTLLYQQNRYDIKDEFLLAGVDAPKKRFLPCRPVNVADFDRQHNIGDRVFGPGERRVIYNMRAIVRAGPGSTVFVTEGEKNANQLIAAGLLATTVISHKWTDECVAALTGFDLIILEDHDEGGHKLASKAREKLSRVAKSIRMVTCTHLWSHLNPQRQPSINDDVGNWLDYGGDAAKLIEICREVPTANNNYVIVRAVDIAPRAKNWVWEGHLLRGAQEILTGIPGLGKSMVHCHFAACATTANHNWPDRTKNEKARNVIMVTAEDTLDQELIPRLIAAGADLDAVFILKAIKRDNAERMFLLSEDLKIMEEMINDIDNVGLVMIDPITAFMGKLDSHRTTDVRSQLGPLKDLAERTEVAFSTITHPSKNPGPRAIDHFIGSQAFIAAGRIGHLCAEELDEDKRPTGRVLFTNPKNNPHPKMPTLAYRIEQLVIGQDHDSRKSIAAAHVVWDDDPVSMTADQAVAAFATGRGDRQAMNTAKDFLRQELANGPRLADDIKRAANQAALSWATVRRAKDELGIRPYKDSFSGPWMWVLPEEAL